jgi:glycosyltransferase involved in cell wall biosynthesis
MFPPGKPPPAIRPLRVLFFYPDFGQSGGIERLLSQTAEWLQAGGRIEPIFVCSAGGPFHQTLLALSERAPHPFPVYTVPTPRFFLKSWWRTFDVGAWRHLADIVTREKPDIAHVHAGLVENLRFRRWGVPVVYTFHGYGTLYSSRPDDGRPLPLPKRLGKALIRHMFRFMAARLDALLFVSHAEKHRMMVEGYLPPVTDAEAHRIPAVLPNGVPVAEIRRQAAVSAPNTPANAPAPPNSLPTIRESLGIPAEARCVGFINRLDDNKNPRHFLELARRLATDTALDGPHFLLAGDGPLQAEIEREARLVPNMHVLGYRPDVPALLGALDLLVYPSRREGFGLGLVEAMAAGTSCVAYASAGAAEILDRPPLTACLVPVDDQAALYREAVRLLNLSDGERTALSAALQARAGDFDASRFVDRLEAVYRGLCPLVSVILPVFQGEDTIADAVASVLNQTYPRFELLVVDDGSTDGTPERLQAITDPRVRAFSRPNGGVAAARNFAFEQARGDYIAFIDADDRWRPDKLAAEVAVLRRRGTPGFPPVCLVYSGYDAVDETGRLIHRPPVRHQSGDLSNAVLEDEGLFLPSTTLLHRQIYEAVGGFSLRCHHEDRAFFIAACRQFPAYPTGKRLTLYRQSPDGRCRNVLADFERALNAEQSIADSLRPILPPDVHERLECLQRRNLLYRFLMYNQPGHARRLYARFFRENAAMRALLQGKKGFLTRLALKTGINFSFPARLAVQGIYRRIVSPLWSSRFNRLDVSNTPAPSPAQPKDSLSPC